MGECENRQMRAQENSESVPYAMAYVRVQDWEKPLDAAEALRKGTAFGCLEMPFEGRRACE